MSTESQAAPGSRLGLSRERIVEGALELLDRDGLDAFSMRRLAEEPGVGTMTVYGYFRGKDELLEAVVDLGGEQIAQRVSEVESGGSWKPRLRELMLGVHAAPPAPTGVVGLAFQRPPLD